MRGLPAFAIGLATSLACGSAAPTSVSTTPGLVGTWSGPSVETWIENAGAGPFASGVTCAETWTITTQSADAFAGTYLLSPPAGSGANCSGTGAVNGVVAAGGAITATTRNDVAGPCSLVAGDRTLTGALAADGTIVAKRGWAERCPPPADAPAGTPFTTYDDIVETLTLARSR